MIRRLKSGEDGSAMITALLATIMLLALGMALLSIVDTQADQSAQERTRDRAFNVSETVLNSEAFVLGRNWPTTAPAGDPTCSAAGAGFDDPIGIAAGSTPASERLRRNLTESYNPATDPAYAGATWQVNICDDDDPDGSGPLPGPTVWNDSMLGHKAWDSENNGPGKPKGNGRVWVRAQATVAGKTRVLAGLVRVTKSPVVDSRYALVAGGISDDLGASLNTITNQGVLGQVVTDLFGSTKTVEVDPTAGAPTPNGITGLRCGAADIIGGGSPCVSGTLGAAAAVPVVASLVTGDKIENFPRTTSTPNRTIEQLRNQARTSGTYTAVSAGTAPITSSNPLNLTDTAPASVTACTITGAPDQNTVAFVEQVGNTGAENAVGGRGDQYCAIDVTVAKRYKAIVVASGRVVIRGDNTTTASTDTARNNFTGVVYGLNLQRLDVDKGGRGLGDVTAREVVRIDRGAHIQGAVHADGRSARVGSYPPPLTINTNTLVDALIPCVIVLGLPVCILRDTIKALTTGLTGIVDSLLNNGVSVTNLANALLTQVRPQRASYGPAITANVAAINALTTYGPSAVVPGTFRDLQAR